MAHISVSSPSRLTLFEGFLEEGLSVRVLIDSQTVEFWESWGYALGLWRGERATESPIMAAKKGEEESGSASQACALK